MESSNFINIVLTKQENFDLNASSKIFVPDCFAENHFVLALFITDFSAQDLRNVLTIYLCICHLV